MIGGFARQGQVQSQEYALEVCTICRAPIRVSIFLLVFFGYQLIQTCQAGFRLWNVLLLCGQEAILILTVLCHEFGHGSAARAIGGEIDHILLWPFGGICFSSRPHAVTDPKRVLRNDLTVVAAGPATHLAMAPVWALLLCAFGEAIGTSSSATCQGMGCVWAFADPLGLAGPALLADEHGVPLIGHAAGLLWQLLGIAIRVNVSLFLFNVFFPMYPADGAKLLTVSLMHCFGVSPRCAAAVLVGCSSCCAVALIGYALWALRTGSVMAGLLGVMGLMSLAESYRIYTFREQQRLHTHPLFLTARSSVVRRRDAHGQFSQLNQADVDDPVEGGGLPLRGPCCLCLCCGPGTTESGSDSEESVSAPSPPLPRALRPPASGAAGAAAPAHFVRAPASAREEEAELQAAIAASLRSGGASALAQ